MSDYLAVYPGAMLSVSIRNPDGNRIEKNVISCRYVAVVREARQLIAVELLYDPANPKPDVAYECITEYLKRDLLPPDDLLEVRPYLKGEMKDD